MPKLKKSASRRDLVGGQGAARDLDHRPELVVDLDAAGRLADGRRLLLEEGPRRRQLVHVADERDHDLRDRVAAGLLDRDLGVEDRPGLDLHEVRDHQPEPAAAQARASGSARGGERIVARSSLSSSRRAAGILRPGDLDELLLEVRQELVERRVDQADDDRQAVHRLEDALEVALLEDLELGHRGVERGDRRLLVGGQLAAGRRACALARVARVGDEDRAADDLEPLALAEHVLGPAQADAAGAVAPGLGGLLGLVGVRPDGHPAESRRPSRGSSGARAGPRSGPRPSGSRPTKTSPVEPSTLIQSPSLKLRPLSVERALFAP